mmetsp:Transcript_52122/g.161771  ORF Transcript_52122/g.161771 Transcript_52122/m.161771 type:complete len:136 (+) Transcript_52122:61-468(+)
MRSTVRRLLTLLLMLLATGAQGGVIKTLIASVYETFAGDGCNKACKATAANRAQALLSKVDEDQDGFVTVKEMGTIIKVVFLESSPGAAEKTFSEICANMACNQEMGIPHDNMRRVFMSKPWREAMNKRAAAGEL